MNFKVIWSSSAESRLDEIFNYYSSVANILIAKKIVQGIIKETLNLRMNPLIGQIEPLLKEHM